MGDNIVEVSPQTCYSVTVSPQSQQSVVVDTSVCAGSSIDTSLYYLNSNPSGFITSSQAGGVLSINNVSGFVTLTGIGGTNVSISGQIIQISGGSSFDTGQYILTGDIIKYKAFLTSGLETEFISYPGVFENNPTSINCQFENNIDNLVYATSISGVSNIGFYINYSDYLSTSGYKINIMINK